MIMIYDMSTGTFEINTDNCTVESLAENHVTSGYSPVVQELAIQEFAVEPAPETSVLTPELATMDSDAFLRSMK